MGKAEMSRFLHLVEIKWWYGRKEESRLGIENFVSVDFFILSDLAYNNQVLNVEKKGTVIEVNGPSQFSVKGGQTRNYDYIVQTLKKKELLEAMVYLYIDVPNYKWRNLRQEKNAKISYFRYKL